MLKLWPRFIPFHHRDPGGAASYQLPKAKFGLAEVDARTGRLEEAEALYRESLDMTKRAGQSAFPEAKALEDQGLQRILYRNNPQDYARVGEVWKGKHPEDGSDLIVEDGIPEGAATPVLDEEPQLTAPGIGAIDDETLRQILSRLEA